MAYFFLEETRSDHDPRIFDDKDEGNLSAVSGIMATSGNNGAPTTDTRPESYGTFNHVQVKQNCTWDVNSDGSPLEISREIIFSKRIVMLMAGLGIYCYHSMAYDSLLPIFLQDSPDAARTTGAALSSATSGGLGMNTKQVGIIMSVNGLIALFIQGVVFPLLTDTLGIWRTFQAITLLYPIVYFIVPFIAALSSSYILPGIYAALTVRNLFLIPAYPLFLILIKEAGNARYLGKINGLAASVGAVARCASPPISGALYAQGTSLGFAGLAWWGTGLIAILGSLQLFWITREKTASSTVRLPCAPASENARKDEVHILVREIESEENIAACV